MSSKLSVYISNMGEYVAGVLRGTWIKLPVPQDKLSSILASIGIDNHSREYFIADTDSMFANLHISEFARIEELNELAEKLDELPEYEIDKLGAILECESSLSIAKLLELLDSLDSFDLLAEVTSEKELGEYYLDEVFCDVPENVRYYIDTERFGRDIHLENGNGTFTSYGYLTDNR